MNKLILHLLDTSIITPSTCKHELCSVPPVWDVCRWVCPCFAPADRRCSVQEVHRGSHEEY